MKDKRIVAAFDKVSLPIDREDALLARILMEADAARASAEQERNAEDRLAKTAGPRKKDSARIPKKRKALLIAIAAILLLLSACAAYAIYWSSTQRAKEYSQSEQAVDDRQALAERSADEIIKGTMYYGAVADTAEIDGIKLEAKAVGYWPNDDPPQVYVAFDAFDAKTDGIERLYDIDYVLTVNGKAYPAYAKADGTVRELPAIARADNAALGAQYEIWFRMDDGQAVTDGTPMTLTGELFDYDGDGRRGGSRGGFSLNFTYTVPYAKIEAERERLIADVLNQLDAKAEARAETLAGLPDKMTPLGITQDEYTFTDAQATAEGFVLGKTVVTRGADAPTVYMDGYIVQGETMSSIFTPDTSRQRLDVSWEVAYYGTSETVARYPWYAPLDELPETVLFAILRDAGSTQHRKGSMTGQTDEMISYMWDAIELLLRVNPRTGEIVLPKDDAERMAWREEADRLKDVDDRNASFTLKLDGEQTVGDVTVRLYDMIVMSKSRLVMVEWLINGMYYPWEEYSAEVQVYIDGILQSEWQNPEHEPYVFSPEKAEKLVEQNGGWQKYHDCFGDFSMDMRANDLPETFTLRIVFDLYDRNEAWERVFVGTFDLTTTVKKSELAPWDSSNFMG